MKRMEWMATRSAVPTFKLNQGLSPSALVVVYRRKSRSHSWRPWRAVSQKEALRLLGQPHDYELQIGGADGI